MDLYLPIAEMSVNALVILALGGAVGFLSGLFGVGGGFLLTPLLIFAGVPPPVAVATAANQVVASSVSGVLAHWRRGTLDVKMGLVLLAGGVFGSLAGDRLFSFLSSLGQIELAIQICYVVFLGGIGGMMLFESLAAIIRRIRGTTPPRRRRKKRSWVQTAPFRTRFRASKLYISVLPPLGVGFGVGVLASVMGVGGGFIMVPAMIYVLGMPASMIAGTSLFQIMFVTSLVTVLHAVNNQTVDVMLAGLLLIGGVIGPQIGARVGVALKGDQLRLLLALLVVAVCVRLAVDLVATPADPYSIAPVGDAT